MSTLVTIGTLLISVIANDCNDEGWIVNFIEQSTQFGIHNPCNDKEFLTIKMQSIIEYDSDDQQTMNRVSSFASTDWNWLNLGGVIAEYQNHSVIKNVFQAFDILNEESVNVVDFNLTTILFREEGQINDGFDVIHIKKNTLKFNIDIENWLFEDDDNYVELCINLITNKANNNENTEHDEHNWPAGDFNMYTLDKSECRGNSNGSVTSLSSVMVFDDTDDDSNNQRDLCFRFEYCESGNIYYDPIITYNASPKPGSINLLDAPEIGVSITFGFLLAIGLVAGVYYCCNIQKQAMDQALLGYHGRSSPLHYYT